MPERILGNLLGRATGPTPGRDANLHGLGDLDLGIIGFISHLPQSLPTALGVAMSFRRRGQPRIALTTVGDGGFTAGLTHETLNMASLYQAPFVLVVENNKYAYSTPLGRQMRSARFADKAAAYDIPSTKGDGNHFDEVYAAISTGVARARKGGGPTVIEADKMRMQGHAIHDGAGYVPNDLVLAWEARDPVKRLRQRLLDDCNATVEHLDAIDRQTRLRIQKAVVTAEAAPMPDASRLYDGIYA